LIQRDGLQTIPFDLLEEAWNEYIFSDNVVVRTRTILTTVTADGQFGDLNFHTENVTAVSAPNALKSNPGDFEQGSAPNLPRWECIILLRNEKWNRYSIDGGARGVRIIFIANRAFKIMNAFDKFGQPIYNIEGRTLIKLSEKN
jgi:hypothetical protein